MGKQKKKATDAKRRKSGSAAMAEAGLKQGVYWLTADEAASLREAADFRGQSVMSLVQHLIRTGSQQILRDKHAKNL